MSRGRTGSTDSRSRRWQGNPDGSGKRPSVYMGKVSHEEYGEIKRHLLVLQQARRFGRQPSGSTLAWLQDIGDDLHTRIVRAGLCDPRPTAAPANQALANYVALYIERRTDLGKRTVLNLRQTETRLVEHFGKARSLASITVGDAKAFRQGLEAKGYATATISMFVKKARQLFEDAVDHEVLKSNPFKRVPAGSQVNAGRMQYVSVATVEAAMAVASPEYRLILALARYAGLRCPSELTKLTWGNVLWD